MRIGGFENQFLGYQGWVEIFVKLNVTTLFDPDQTLCTQEYVAKYVQGRESVQGNSYIKTIDKTTVNHAN